MPEKTPGYDWSFWNKNRALGDEGDNVLSKPAAVGPRKPTRVNSSTSSAGAGAVGVEATDVGAGSRRKRRPLRGPAGGQGAALMNRLAVNSRMGGG